MVLGLLTFEQNNGKLLNAIDWLSRPIVNTPLAKKPVAIMGASTGRFGTVRAQKHLRDILFSINMQPVTRPEILIGEAKENIHNGKFIDEKDISY